MLDGSIVRVSDAEMEMTEWINYLVMKNMPISLVVDCCCPRHTRRITKLKAVSSKSVKKHILSAYRHVGATRNKTSPT